jgi:hypothetical protein
MKYQTTKKDVLNGTNNIIVVDYCSLQNLLTTKDANAYTCGVYGWNADIYNLGYNTICTGYRPFGNIRPSYDLVKKYDKKAETICNQFYHGKIKKWETLDRKLTKLIDAFCTECLGSDAND